MQISVKINIYAIIKASIIVKIVYKSTCFLFDVRQKHTNKKKPQLFM